MTWMDRRTAATVRLCFLLQLMGDSIMELTTTLQVLSFVVQVLQLLITCYNSLISK